MHTERRGPLFALRNQGFGWGEKKKPEERYHITHQSFRDPFLSTCLEVYSLMVVIKWEGRTPDVLQNLDTGLLTELCYSFQVTDIKSN
jgi:hypothetical protein